MPFIAFLIYLIVIAYLGENLLPSLVVGAFGAYGILIAACDLQRPSQIKKLNEWPTTIATITESKFERDLHHTRDVDSPKLTGSLAWLINLRYTFEIDGVSYHSRNIFSNVLGKSTFSKKKAIEFVTKHKADSKITIHYNPEDHSDSFIYHPESKHALIGGLIIACLCGYLVINGGASF